ncbi:polysaccharide deacetylase family protein [Ramlibacter tataouinensis]|uniref:GlcNAc deacetylase, Carbohydrate Esterase Family 4-like protein n=1 Tax=Ramlibacter tataouinensis (strain ATCC BAA-407 / DSM 14655 / LMG 21543 / TTB310) TaxID=365046 RepID=F5XW51_RAMTT|nr:polysaccharide deacetylase family protein [Ramlibacter tataouinensis]AEG94154.1 GlcNAc deacetylase, Carbohydrate Esterase Family 4-like protein [Ramlibacter tataouinensis TTB310]
MIRERNVQAGPVRPIPIFTYHQLGLVPGSDVPYRTFVTSPEKFARQMSLLHALCYKGLSMRELEPYLRGEKTGKVAGITIDDGYRNTFEQALPVLRYYGFSSTCYMVSGQVGGSNVWDLEHGIAEQPLMDARQLKAWIASGQEVGSHTRNHVNLSRSDDATARQEITGSRQDLEKLLETEIRHFCYPYGGHDAQHLDMVREAGYVTATTTEERRASRLDTPQALPRFTMFHSTSQLGLWARLNVGVGLLRGRGRRVAPPTPSMIAPGLHVPS